MLDPAQNDDGTMFNPLPSTDHKRVARAIAAPPLLTDGGTGGRTEPLGGLTINPSSSTKINFADDSQSGLNKRLAAMQKANGGVDSVTAQFNNPEQNAALRLNDRFVPGGVVPAMTEGNAATARANTARGEMIDSMIAANGGNGIGLLGVDQNGMTQTDRDNQEKTQRWRIDELASMRNPGAANIAVAEANKQAAQRGQDLANGAELARQGLTMRGQDLALQRAQERNDVIARGQDVRADVAGERIASNEAIAGARIAERAGRPEQTGRLTTAQQRSNAEIDAARTAIAGLTPEEIKRRTANFTATGRENPDFDPTLAKSVSQANRRKFGDDQDFDQRQQPQQPAGAADHGYDRKDVAQRFRSERAMDRYKLGNDTPNGVEVLDSAGKVVGHYR